MQREIKFRGVFPAGERNIVIPNVAIYEDGSMGCEFEVFTKAIAPLELWEDQIRTPLSEDGETGYDLVATVNIGEDWIYFEGTPLQYTGLKDRNRKEIYESDIRQFEHGIGIIVWEDAAFAVKSPGSEAVNWEHSSVMINSTYLGNLYETPHLIK